MTLITLTKLGAAGAGVTGSSMATAIAATEGVSLSSVHVFAIIGVAGSVIGTLFWKLLAAKDSEHAALMAEKDRALKDKDKALEEVDSLRETYQKFATEAIHSATETANYYLAKEGKPPVMLVAPVIPESNSPSTAKQREAALVGTMKANLVAVLKATGQPPKPEPERAKEAKPK